MREGTSLSFGVVIAFLAPGALTLWGLSHYSPTVREWFGVAANTEASLGGFLFVVLSSLAAGVFVSGLRWAVIDTIMEHTGVVRPDMDFSKLMNPDCLRTFNLIVENRYRYYQFYSNSLVAVLIAYVSWNASQGVTPWKNPWVLGLTAGTVVVLYFSARDSLKGYFREAEQLMGPGDGGMGND